MTDDDPCALTTEEVAVLGPRFSGSLSADEAKTAFHAAEEDKSLSARLRLHAAAGLLNLRDEEPVEIVMGRFRKAVGLDPE